MTIITVPPFSDCSSIIGFYKYSDAIKENSTFDFSGVGFATPKGMILLSSILNILSDRGLIGEVVGEQKNTYAINMGFYKSFGCDFDGCNAQGGVRYFPVTKIMTSLVQEEATGYKEELGENIERRSGYLAGILTQEYESEVYKLIKYTLREIMRNVVEHSESKYILAAGQYWPATGEVELAISDCGIGLRSGLSSNPHLKITSDYNAIKYSLMPGVSGKNFAGAALGKRTNWTNSGFGLFMTSQIVRKTGEFFIGSGDTFVTLGRGVKSHGYFGIPGTTISLRINVAALSRTEALLAVLAKKGENISKIIGVDGDIEASAASRLIFD